MLSPDPLDHALELDDRLDDAQAAARGARLLTIAEALVSELVGEGYLPARYTGPARVHCFTVLANHLYANATIEIPRGLGSTRALERRTNAPDAPDAA